MKQVPHSPWHDQNKYVWKPYRYTKKLNWKTIVNNNRARTTEVKEF